MPVSARTGKYFSNPATMRAHDANAGSSPATPAIVGAPTDQGSPIDSDQTADTVICPKCGTEFTVPDADQDQGNAQGAAAVPVVTK